MFKITLLALALISLGSCGGDSASDSSDYETTLQQANAEEAEAISLAPASPCSQVQQCGYLTFVNTSGHCSTTRYVPYSLVSPTAAAASAAAADEVALATHALDIAPPSSTACTASIALPPTLACVSSTCVSSR